MRAAIVILALVGMGCTAKEAGVSGDAEHLRRQLAKLAPAEIQADLSRLEPAKRQLVLKLVQASRYMDEIFLRQVYARNPEIRDELMRRRDPLDSLRLEYFRVMFGPFDRLEEDRPFLGDKAKPLGANFYPEDLTREEFARWLESHSQDREAFESNFTVIRRRGDSLVAVPYSEEYRHLLEPAARILEEAAQLAENASLKRYLLTRAEAFRTNDYFESDLAWMDLDDPDIEFVIGPYEVYEDRLFGYKAAFEAFVTLIDREETAKLSIIYGYLDELERNLPIPDPYKNLSRGRSSPIRVVNEVFSAGDTKAGVQTTAFNLPNDERVREAKGSKKVLLRNVAGAKFEKCWRPITARVLCTDQLPLASFNAYFTHTLLHEVSHGLGPGMIRLPDGRTTTVNKELKETYPTIEETKADVLGMYNALFLVNKGVFPPAFRDSLFVTYLGGMFRSIRFGTQEAHGLANLIQFNFLREKKAFLYDEETARFRVDRDRLPEAIRELAHEVLMIQARLDYEGARGFIRKYGTMPAELQAALGRLTDIPIDIRPVYPIEAEFPER
jgi:hypothetical protein